MNPVAASLTRIGALVVKELRQLRRDRLTFAMIVGIPTLQLILFGYAINFDVRHLTAGVADLAQTSASRQLVLDLSQSQILDTHEMVASAAELERLMLEGRIRVGVLIPPDFERRRLDDTRAAVQLLVDGTDPTVLGVAARLTESLGPSRAPANTRLPEFELRNYFNPERRSPVNTVPGLIGVILTLTMVLFTAIAIVRERERGNLEFLIATPVRGPELMVAKILPYLGIGLIQVSLILWLGDLLFAVPIVGTLSDVYLAALLFIAASLGMGLFISTLADTQFQAVQMMLFLLLPSILISGFVFPFDGMPAVIRVIAEALPMTHFVRLIKGVMLRGAELSDLRESVLALAGITVLTLTAATLRFRKRID
jgi:ABC-2 type transport system permease protein